MAKQSSVKAFWCQHRDGYSVISFPREMATAHMAEIREAGGKILEHLQVIKAPACVVDLSALDYMGSSLVATIVRIWKAVKEKQGQMVVVTSNDRIFEVLKATGLAKVWTIEPTFESGVHALGFSPEAKVEKRENRLLKFVGPLSVLGGGLLVAARVIPQIRIPVPIPDWVVYTALGLSLLASGVAMVRERGLQRVLCTLGFLVTVPLLGFFVWYSEIRLPDPSEMPPVAQTASLAETSTSSQADEEQTDSARSSDSEATVDSGRSEKDQASAESASAAASPKTDSASEASAMPAPEAAPANAARTVGGQEATIEKAAGSPDANPSEESASSEASASGEKAESLDEKKSEDDKESSGPAQPADLPVPSACIRQTPDPVQVFG